VVEATRQALKTKTLAVLADTGYSNVEQQQHCEERGIACSIPPRRGINSQGHGQLYQVSNFHYDRDRDTYHCPAGHTLSLKQWHAPKKIGVYANPEACRACPQKAHCTTGSYRRVSRHQYEAAFDISQRRLKADPHAMTRRRATVEHPFGTIKYDLMGNGGRLLVRGLRKGRGEISLAVLAYNLKRLMNHIGTEALKARLGATPA
ncbi:transposase, partial [Chromohalobacter sp. 296-RDG]|uniref:transposase n=1 Tax=Chromohalobacter sp. 296-RDG TaxID=2994062 RepID=UPI002469C451